MDAFLRVVILSRGRSGCPLLDRPKRGRKKPYQLALAHCVRVAGLDARSVCDSPSPPSFAAAPARSVRSESAGASAVSASRAVRGRGVSARSCRRREKERSAPARLSCRRRKYIGRGVHSRTVQPNYTGERDANATGRAYFSIDRGWRSNRGEIEGKTPVVHGKISVRQGRKKGERRAVLVSDARGLGRIENRLAGRENEPVRWCNASLRRSSGGEQKPGGRHHRLPSLLPWCRRAYAAANRRESGAGGRGRESIRSSSPSTEAQGDATDGAHPYRLARRRAFGDDDSRKRIGLPSGRGSFTYRVDRERPRG